MNLIENYIQPGYQIRKLSRQDVTFEYDCKGFVSFDGLVDYYGNIQKVHKIFSIFIKGDLIDYFAGYDNSDWQIEDLHAKHLVKLDNFDSHDSFHIVKTLIFDYDWSFSDIDDDTLTLNRNNYNYSDQILEHYLKTGEVETKENVEEG